MIDIIVGMINESLAGSFPLLQVITEIYQSRFESSMSDMIFFKLQNHRASFPVKSLICASVLCSLLLIS